MISNAESKRTKKENVTQKKIKFPFAWCSWIFDLTSDGRDGLIVKFTDESFPSTRYVPICILPGKRPDGTFVRRRLK